MATLLKDMQITHISLVKNPANMETVIWKSKEAGKTPDGFEALTLSLSTLAKSEEKRMLYGPVYCPGVVDAHGEYAEAAEIAKAAYGFMKHLRGLNVDVQHDFDPKDAYVAESWLTKGKDPLFPDAPEGSWVVGIRVEDEALWKAVKSGELKGLSMAGFAKRVRKDSERTEGAGFMKNAEEFFAGLLKALGKHEEQKAADKEKSEKTKKSDDTGAEGAELLAKYADVFEALGKVPEQMSELSKRLDALERSTPGLKGGSADGGAAGSGDGLEGIL